MKDFREVKVWQKAHRLTVSVYRATTGLANSDHARLTDELRQTCEQISSNLASANLGLVRGVREDPEFTLHMHGALASAALLETRLELARDLQILPPRACCELEQELADVRKTIVSYIRTLGPR